MATIPWDHGHTCQSSQSWKEIVFFSSSHWVVLECTVNTKVTLVCNSRLENVPPSCHFVSADEPSWHPFLPAFDNHEFTLCFSEIGLLDSTNRIDRMASAIAGLAYFTTDNALCFIYKWKGHIIFFLEMNSLPLYIHTMLVSLIHSSADNSSFIALSLADSSILYLSPVPFLKSTASQLSQDNSNPRLAIFQLLFHYSLHSITVEWSKQSSWHINEVMSFSDSKSLNGFLLTEG